MRATVGVLCVPGPAPFQTWGKFVVLTLELSIQLSCLLFLGRIRIALISNKVDCFGVQSQVLE